MRHPERVATYLEPINEAIDRASEYLHDLTAWPPLSSTGNARTP